MPNLNSVMIMGTLTRDPEIKYTPSGKAICQIGVAINSTYKVGDEKREEVTFIDAEAWGKTAEIIGEHLKKGRPIFIQGRLKLDTWDDKQTGQKRTKMKVIIESFQFLGGKPESGQSSQGEERAPQRPPARNTAPSRPPRPTADPDLDMPPEKLPF